MKPFGKKQFKIPYLRGERMVEGVNYHTEIREGFHGRTEPELGPWKKVCAIAEKSPDGKYFLRIENSKLELVDEFDCGEGEFLNHFSVEEHYLIVKDFQFKKIT